MKYNMWWHCRLVFHFILGNTFQCIFSPLPTFTFVPFLSLNFLVLDNKGFPASNVGTAARPCSVHQLHPVPVPNPRGYRLLHLESLITGLHAEPDTRPTGLSGCQLHHGPSFPHQYRDVPGYESQVGRHLKLRSHISKKTNVNHFLIILNFVSHFECIFFRFPQLFPPLKPEVVAQKTVDAVRTDKAFVYLPWTMHALVILKR